MPNLPNKSLVARNTGITRATTPVTYLTPGEVHQLETPSPETAQGAFERAAGGWKGTLDFDAYLKDLYASRRMQSPEITL